MTWARGGKGWTFGSQGAPQKWEFRALKGVFVFFPLCLVAFLCELVPQAWRGSFGSFVKSSHKDFVVGQPVILQRKMSCFRWSYLVKSIALSTYMDWFLLRSMAPL